MALSTNSFKSFSILRDGQTQIEYDGTSTRPVYVGMAEPGVSDATASWLIIKITYDASNRITKVQSATDVTWDARATTTYR